MEETEKLLQQAVNEIQSLRRQNEVMAARLDTFDKCLLLLYTPPALPNNGMSPDLVWEINKHLEQLAKKEN